MNYKYLRLIITSKCNSKCNMSCLSNEKSYSDTVLHSDKVIKLLDEIDKTDKAQRVGFTNGEAILNFDNLNVLTKYVKANNNSIFNISKGIGKADYKETYEKLSKLKSLGLNSISLKYDELFTDYISSDYICNVLGACIEIGLKINILSLIIHDSQIGIWFGILMPFMSDISIQFIPCDQNEYVKINYHYV